MEHCVCGAEVREAQRLYAQRTAGRPTARARTPESEHLRANLQSEENEPIPAFPTGEDLRRNRGRKQTAGRAQRPKRGKEGALSVRTAGAESVAGKARAGAAAAAAVRGRHAEGRGQNGSEEET